MSAKKWTVKTVVKKNNDVVKGGFGFYGEQSELEQVLAKLEGGYEVVEVNETLSDMSGADTNVTETNPVEYIKMKGDKKQTEYISGYNGPIHFKNSVNAQDIADMCNSFKPFELLPTKTPNSTTVQRSEIKLGGETVTA